MNNFKKLDLDPSLYPDIWTFDNFYSEEYMALLDDYMENIPPVEEFQKVDLIGSKYVMMLRPSEVGELCNTHHPLVKELFSQYRPHRLSHMEMDRISIVDRLQVVSPNYNYPPHKDQAMKIMTFIVYVQGSDGTIFRGNENLKELEYEIPFKKNSGYFFFPDGTTTWHRFQETAGKIRSTTVINLNYKSLVIGYVNMNRSGCTQ